MSENTEPLRKMTRSQLLEILVEQSKAVGEIRERMEQLNSMALRANRLEMERSGAENAIRTAEKQAPAL